MNQIEGKKSRMDLSEPATYADKKNHSKEQYGFTIVLDSKDVSSVELFKGAKIFRASALPINPAPQTKAKKIKPAQEVPKKIRDMRRLYEYSDGSFRQKCKNFYRQALFMADYEDDEPWGGEYVRYFPTYHELSLRELRGYFSWRAHIRKGEFYPIAASLAYMYLYELLNRIGPGGIISAEESLEKMREFEKGWLDSGFGGATMRENLRRWMLEFAVVQNVPPEIARNYAAEIFDEDNALLALKAPDAQSNEAVVRALCVFAEKRTASSPVFENAKGKHLFAELWRRTVREFAADRKDLFAACFGSEKTFFWHPLANAVYFEQTKQTDRVYVLDDCRSFHLQNGKWTERRYEKLFFDKTIFGALMHEADRKLRLYLKTGRYLREKAEEAWATPYIDAVIDDDKKAEIEARRPKIAIDFSSLDKIRADALATAESLLTEAELAEANEVRGSREENEIARTSRAMTGTQSVDKAAAFSLAKNAANEFGLRQTRDNRAKNATAIFANLLYAKILAALLAGESADEIIKGNHLMPEIVADEINETLFDEIGDNAVVCEGDKLSIIEDYKTDVAKLLEANK